MRRLLAAAALGAVILSSAACSNSGTPTTSATTAAATSAAAASGNTKEICDSINAAGEQMKTSMTGLFALAGEKDQAKITEALTNLGKDLLAFGTDIQAKAATATDPELKTALEETQAAMQAAAPKFADPALQKDPAKALDILADPQITKALEDLSKICPGIA